MFVIEKNIPIPEVAPKYPFHEMEIGDSFLANESVGSSISLYKKNNEGVDFTTKRMPDGVRVWRTK